MSTDHKTEITTTVGGRKIVVRVESNGLCIKEVKTETRKGHEEVFISYNDILAAAEGQLTFFR